MVCLMAHTAVALRVSAPLPHKKLAYHTASRIVNIIVDIKNTAVFILNLNAVHARFFNG